MQQQTAKNKSNTLKNIDFLAWQIRRGQNQRHQEEVNRTILHRTRHEGDSHTIN